MSIDLFPTDLSKLETEIMTLDISKKGSKFYSSDKKMADSIISSKSGQNFGPMDFSGIKFGKVQEVVEKMYLNFDIYFKE